MHEFAIVEATLRETLDGLDRALERIGVERQHVSALRFQRGSTFSEEALRQAFEILAVGTLLENARLMIETINHQFTCVCGHKQIITTDDLVGHIFVCPACGVVNEVDEAHDLKLIEIVIDADPMLNRAMADEDNHAA